MLNKLNNTVSSMMLAQQLIIPVYKKRPYGLTIQNVGDIIIYEKVYFLISMYKILYIENNLLNIDF